LVECILLEMYSDPFGPHWLGHVLSFLRDRVGLTLEMSSFEEFKTSFLLIDRASFREQITRRCHQICYPPSPSRSILYNDLDLSSASSWLCFSSSTRHYRLSRLFASDSFRFNKTLTALDSERECEVCHVPPTVEHWFLCPLRDNDRVLFSKATNSSLSCPRDLRTILRDPTLLVALEFALSKSFGS
jgi:hypothetical protein